MLGCRKNTMSGLRQLAVRGFLWTAISSRVGTQILAVVILARLLPPSDFGLLAMATVIIGFAGLFRDLGTAAAIIQKTDPTPQLLDSLFWLNAALGTGIAALLGLLAPLIALGFAEPRLAKVLWMLLFTFPIAGLGSVHQALLEKASSFRPLAMIESTAAIVALGGAVLAAWHGWGVFSLVLQSLLTTIFTTTGLWFASRWRPQFNWNADQVRGVMGFGGNLVGFNVFNFIVRNLDNMLIGRFLGSSDLGYYSMAYRLMLWPLQNVSAVVGRALFPVLSQLQMDKDRLAEAYVRTIAAIALITAPLMFGFFVLREPLVTVALGERWQPVVGVLTWLVPLGLLQSVGTTVGTLYLATGQTGLMFRWGVLAGLVISAAFVLGMRWGITGVAASYAVASGLLFWPSLVIPFRLVHLRPANVLIRLMPSIVSAAAMALVIVLIAAAWPGNTGNQLLRLIMLSIAGVVAYGVISLIFQRKLLADIIRVGLSKRSQ